MHKIFSLLKENIGLEPIKEKGSSIIFYLQLHNLNFVLMEFGFSFNPNINFQIGVQNLYE